MPDPDVFLPFDHHRLDLAVGEEGLGRLDGRRETGMPGGKQRPSGLPRRCDQRTKFADGGTRRLFEQHVLAGLQRGRRLRVTPLRRRAQRNGIDVWRFREHLIERREMRDAFEGRIAARDRSEFNAVGGGDRRDVLIPRDLAETDDGNSDDFHYLPHRSTSGPRRFAISTRPARTAGCSGCSGRRTVSCLITPPSFISALQAIRPHWRFS